VEQVEPSDGERRQLTESQPTESRQQHQCTPTRAHRVGQPVDLCDAHRRTFRRVLIACTCDGTRVSDELAVGDCGVADRAQQSIALSGRARTGTVRTGHHRVPGPHHSRIQAAKLYLPQDRQDVPVELSSVDLPRSRRQRATLDPASRQPLVGETTQGLLAGSRVEPGATADVGLDAGEVAIGRRLGRERVGCRDEDAPRASG
jgi:hypothetical protein